MNILQHSSSLLPSLGCGGEVEGQLNAECKSLTVKSASLYTKNTRGGVSLSHHHISEYQVLCPFIPVSYHHSSVYGLGRWVPRWNVLFSGPT